MLVSQKTDRVDSEKNQNEILRQIFDVDSEFGAALGLNELESLIYLNLLRTGPITASMLSKEAGLERTKTYRIVENLINEGIVSVTFSTPKLCVPLDPEEAFNKAIQKKEEEISRLKQIKEKSIQRVKGVVAASYGTDLPTFRIVQNHMSIYSNIELLLEKSTGTVYIITTLNDASKMYYSHIPEKIQRCQKNGIAVRLIIDEEEGASEFVTRLNISEARKGNPSSHGRVVVSKQGQMIMSDSSRSASNLTGELDFALCTNSKEMVNNIFRLCTFLWRTSKPIEL